MAWILEQSCEALDYCDATDTQNLVKTKPTQELAATFLVFQKIPLNFSCGDLYAEAFI